MRNEPQQIQMDAVGVRKTHTNLRNVWHHIIIRNFSLAFVFYVMRFKFEGEGFYKISEYNYIIIINSVKLFFLYYDNGKVISLFSLFEPWEVSIMNKNNYCHLRGGTPINYPANKIKTI